MPTALHAGERDWLTAVVAAPLDDLKKLVYADWLEERGDPRAAFLRGYVEATKSIDPAKLPPADGLPEEWLALIGFRITELLANTAPALREAAFQVARPALRLIETKVKEDTLPDGVSKLGGRPDLPPGFAWPTGRDCRTKYNNGDHTARLAGFLGQIRFEEIAHTQAAKVLPPSGLLSFFAFQDGENDNPDTLGIKCFYFLHTAALVRTKAPKRLTLANKRLPTRRLGFEETLSLPLYPYYRNSGALRNREPKWGSLVAVDPAHNTDMFADGLWSFNLGAMLGYDRSQSTSDTESPDSRNFITLINDGGFELHLLITTNDLIACNFDAMVLDWVV